jgi:FkbM family methyltransferase
MVLERDLAVAGWGFPQKLRFLTGYFLAKVGVIWRVRRPRWTFVLFEFKYSMANFLNTVWPGSLKAILYEGPREIETTTGTFLVRTRSQDAAIISPAFERADFSFLEALIREQVADHVVDFLDIGANIGAFTVRVGRLGPSPRLRVWAFEPIEENFKLLVENVRLNGLGESVRAQPLALGDRSGSLRMTFSRLQPGDARVVGGSDVDNELPCVLLRRADEVIDADLDVLVAKIDVEGFERQVIDGMEGLFSRASKCWLCVEDIFDGQALYEQLGRLGFKFVAKKTPYNSWWFKA